MEVSRQPWQLLCFLSLLCWTSPCVRVAAQQTCNISALAAASSPIGGLLVVQLPLNSSCVSGPAWRTVGNVIISALTQIGRKPTWDTGNERTASPVLVADGNVTIQGVQLLNVAFSSLSNGTLSLPLSLPFVSSKLLNLENTYVDTSCSNVAALQLIFATTSTQGTGWLFLNSFQSEQLTATNVNISCSWALTTTGNFMGTALAARDGYSLINALYAANNYPGLPAIIAIQADITLGLPAPIQPVWITRSITFVGDIAVALVKPMLDWAGHQEIMAIRTPGVFLTFNSLDHMNWSPLLGVYRPWQGAISSFVLPFWVVFYDPVTTNRLTNPTVFNDALLVLPLDEYNFWVLFAVAITSPVSDAIQLGAFLRGLTQRAEYNQASPKGIVAFFNLEFLGNNMTNVGLAKEVPARITYPLKFADASVPKFVTDAAATDLWFTSTITVYTEDNLLTGLQQLQDSPETETVVTVSIFNNLTLSKVASQWPVNGFNLHTTSVQFTAVTYGTRPRPFTVLDLTGITQLIGQDTNSSRVSFAGYIFMDMPGATGPQENILPYYNTTSLSFLPQARSGSIVPRIILNGSSLIVPYSEFVALANRLQSTVATSPWLSYNIDSSTGTAIQLSDLKTPGWTGSLTTMTYVPPPGFALNYANTFFPPSPPPGALDAISHGPSTDVGMIVGIVVGVVGAAIIVLAVAAVFLARRNKEERQEAYQQGVKVAVESGSKNTPTDSNTGLVNTPADKAAIGTITSMTPHTVSADRHESSTSKAHFTPAAELQQVLENLAHDFDEHLMILEVVGQGGFGIVYKGQWKGLMVAVKTITFQDRMVCGDKAQHTAIMEAAISTSLAHPNVVLTYSYDIKPLSHQPTNRGMRILSNIVTDWKLFIIQEFCDAGSLRQAVLRRKMWDETRRRPNVQFVLDCVLELASGLAHLHMRNIIHGDLNPNNVLLKKDPSSRRGVACKLCDFGLSIRLTVNQSHISNMRRGTPFYTAPEVVNLGNMAKSADVFSFGVMMWECVHSQTCYSVLPDNSFQQRENFPHFISTCPVAYGQLATQCIHPDCTARPTMAQVVERLEGMQRALGSLTIPPRTLSTSIATLS